MARLLGMDGGGGGGLLQLKAGGWRLEVQLVGEWAGGQWECEQEWESGQVVRSNRGRSRVKKNGGG